MKGRFLMAGLLMVSNKVKLLQIYRGYLTFYLTKILIALIKACSNEAKIVQHYHTSPTWPTCCTLHRTMFDCVGLVWTGLYILHAIIKINQWQADLTFLAQISPLQTWRLQYRAWADLTAQKKRINSTLDLKSGEICN